MHSMNAAAGIEDDQAGARAKGGRVGDQLNGKYLLRPIESRNEIEDNVRVFAVETGGGPKLFVLQWIETPDACFQRV